MGDYHEPENCAIRIIKDITGDRLKQPTEQKCRTLFRLAQEVADGCILELGTFHGIGAIALTLGVRNIPEGDHRPIVFTIDDYIAKRGWAGELYVPEDRETYYENVRTAFGDTDPRPCLMTGNIVTWADNWNFAEFPIGLFFWDLGCINRAPIDLGIWWDHIAEGGLVVLHDTTPPRLGAPAAMKRFNLESRLEPWGMWVAQKGKE